MINGMCYYVAHLPVFCLLYLSLSLPLSLAFLLPISLLFLFSSPSLSLVVTARFICMHCVWTLPRHQHEHRYSCVSKTVLGHKLLLRIKRQSASILANIRAPCQSSSYIWPLSPNKFMCLGDTLFFCSWALANSFCPLSSQRRGEGEQAEQEQTGRGEEEQRGKQKAKRQ